MDKFTPEFIAGQLAIAAKATPRPWKFYDAFDIVGKPGVVGSNRLGTDDTTVIGADGYNEIHVIEDDAVYLCAAAKNYPAALAEIERLREAQRWIPVGERMPEIGVWVLIRRVDGAKGMWRRFESFVPGWQNETGVAFSLRRVTHWMPLPEPPQEAEGN